MSLGLMRALPLRRKRIEARSLSLSILFGSALALAAFLSLLYLTQTATVATTGYDIKRLEEEKGQWQIRNEQLRLKIDQLKSLDRVEKEAAARLKMGPPEKLAFMTVEPPSKTPSVAGLASGAPNEPDPKSRASSGWWEEIWRRLRW